MGLIAQVGEEEEWEGGEEEWEAVQTQVGIH